METKIIPDYEKEEMKLVREAVSSLSKLVNSYGYPSTSKKFIEEMSREHRTLQQGMTSLMLAWFIHLAKLDENQYDARNEASVRIAKKIINATEGVSRLPCI